MRGMARQHSARSKIAHTSGGSICWRGDHPSSAGVLLIHGNRKAGEPVQKGEGGEILPLSATFNDCRPLALDRVRADGLEPRRGKFEKSDSGEANISQNQTSDFSMSLLKSLGARLLTPREPGRYSFVDQHPFVIELSIVLQIS